MQNSHRSVRTWILPAFVVAACSTPAERPGSVPAPDAAAEAAVVDTPELTPDVPRVDDSAVDAPGDLALLDLVATDRGNATDLGAPDVGAPDVGAPDVADVGTRDALPGDAPPGDAPPGDAAPDAPTADATLTYPPGPYGNREGSVLANLSWDGFVNPTGERISTMVPYVRTSLNAQRGAGRGYALVHISEVF